MIRLEQDYLQLLREHGLKPQDLTSPEKIYSQLPGSTPLVKSLLASASQNDASNDQRHPFEDAVKLIHRVSDKRLANALNSIYFNVFPTEEYNAISTPTKNGYLCLVNDGLAAIASIISSSLALCTVEVDEQPSLVKLDYLLKSIEGRIAVNSIFDILVQYVTYKKLVPRSELLSLSLQPFQCNIMACLNLSLKAFVVSHECSHVVLNHFDSSLIRYATTPTGDIKAHNPDFAAEFAADQEATRILLRIAHIMGYESGISFSVGGAMFLAIAILIEIIDGRINKAESRRVQYGNTHPSAQVRLMRINEYSRGALPSSARSLPIGQLLGELIDLALRAKFIETDHGIEVKIQLPTRKSISYNDDFFDTGVKLYESKKYIKAVDSFEKYIHLREQERPVDVKGIAHALTLMGNCYMELNLTAKQKECLRRSIDLYNRSKSYTSAYFNMKLLGDCYFMEKNYTKALSCFTPIINHYKDVLSQSSEVLSAIAPVTNDEYEATFYNQLAICYLELKKYELSIDFSKKAIDILHGTEHHEMIIKYLGYLGIAYFKNHNYSKACECFKERFSRFRAMKFDQKRIETDALVFLDTCMHYMSVKDIQRVFKDLGPFVKD